MLRDHKPAGEFRNVSRLLGAMVDVELRSPLRRRFLMGEAMEWFYPAIVLNQYVVFADESSRPYGVLTWAKVSTERDRRLAASADSQAFRLEDWNEGPHVWIIDAVSTGPSSAQLIEWARQNLWTQAPLICWRQRVGSEFRGPTMRMDTLQPDSEALQ